MTALDYILVGLERNLELERELGRSRIEIDRSWLDSVAEKREVRSGGLSSDCSLNAKDAKRATEISVTARPSACDGIDFGRGNSTKKEQHIFEKVGKWGSEEVGKSGNEEMVFLHDGELSAAAMEMMEKIFAATKEKGCEAKLVFAEPVPSARAYILLGKAAESRFGSALTNIRKEMIGVSVSPEEFVRFADSPSTKLKKWNLWVDIQRKVQLIKAGRA